MPSKQDLTIKASPTKEFFISILVRDIALVDAINDLVDNCIDGARRIKPKGNFKGLEVHIDYSDKHFSISDNCGGIPVDIARNYAFRFGRTPDTPAIKGAIGQFGVGMKRTLFKMGSRFEIESTTSDATFEVDLQVDKWEKLDEWDFEFKTLKENQDNPSSAWGTRIKVTSLHDGISSELGFSLFENRLRYAIQTSHAQSLEAGLGITIKSRAVIGPHATLLQTTGLQSVFREKTLSTDDKEPVAMRLFAGVAKSDPNEAGWYLSCNGRMILHADQTILTGWGEGKGETIPKYHNQFARFRGFIFLDSKDGENLPWNTTKTGVDPEHPIYQAVRLEMLSATRPIIDFLNKLDAEKNADKQPITDLVGRSSPVRLEVLKHASVFAYSAKEVKPVAQETFARIIYTKPEKQIEKVKKALGVSYLREVGEKTFDYYYNLECK